MALALYRKYRPRTFAEVIGQEHVTEPLSQALRSGRLHHAYLFSGPRGCGKTSSARILARSLNCEQGPTPEPCGVCGSCRSLANDGGGSIDVIEIDAASHGGVDDARELREKAFFAPANSRYKIYVIDEAHMVSPAGFNALLKLVEEPPEYVKFIFATTEPEKVLGTIRSRTHHYPFRLIPPAVLRPYLQQLTEAEGVQVEPAVFPLVVRAGGGSARDTLSVLDQLIAGAGPDGVSYNRAIALLGVTDVTLLDEMCDALAAGDGAAAYSTIDRVAEAGHDPRRFASDLLERFRDLIILQQVPDAVSKGLIDGPTDQLEAMGAQAARLGPATLSRCADIVHNGLVEMRGTTAPRLLLELVTARMLLPGADDSTGALLQRVERMERRFALGGEPLTLPEGGAAPALPAAPVAGGAVAPVSAVPASGGGGDATVGRSAARAAAAAAAARRPVAGAGRPAVAQPGSPAVAPVSAVPVSAAPAEAPVSAAPVSAAPVSAAPVSAAPAPTAPISAAPASGAPVRAAPSSAAPVSAAPSADAVPVAGAAGHDWNGVAEGTDEPDYDEPPWDDDEPEAPSRPASSAAQPLRPAATADGDRQPRPASAGPSADGQRQAGSGQEAPGSALDTVSAGTVAGGRETNVAQAAAVSAGSAAGEQESRGGQGAAVSAGSAASGRGTNGSKAAAFQAGSAASGHESRGAQAAAVPGGSAASGQESRGAQAAAVSSGPAASGQDAGDAEPVTAAASRRVEPAGVLPDAPEEPVTAAVEAAAAGPGKLTAQAVRQVWPEILAEVKRQPGGKVVGAAANDASVRDLEGQTVVLTVTSAPLAERIMQRSALIVNALYEVLGGQWEIRCEIAGQGGAAGYGSTPPDGRQRGGRPQQARNESPRPPAQAARPAPAAQPVASARAPQTRRQEAETPPPADDDWPEPARPGGSSAPAPAAAEVEEDGWPEVRAIPVGVADRDGSDQEIDDGAQSRPVSGGPALAGAVSSDANFGSAGAADADGRGVPAPDGAGSTGQDASGTPGPDWAMDTGPGGHAASGGAAEDWPDVAAAGGPDQTSGAAEGRPHAAAAGGPGQAGGAAEDWPDVTAAGGPGQAGGAAEDWPDVTAAGGSGQSSGGAPSADAAVSGGGSSHAGASSAGGRCRCGRRWPEWVGHAGRWHQRDRGRRTRCGCGRWSAGWRRAERQPVGWRPAGRVRNDCRARVE